jgi:hypothetical protein
VNQADVARLQVDQEVEVAVEAVAGLKATGVVERIAPQATIRNNIKGFAARVLLKNVDQRVRPGMTANIKIPVASADGVMAVPLAAVFTERNPETGEMERYVYVVKGNTHERRSVQVGVSDYFFAEIQSGLWPNEVVSLELPKEERDKQAKGLAATRPGAGPGGPAVASGGARGPRPPGERGPGQPAVSGRPGGPPAAASSSSGSGGPRSGGGGRPRPGGGS